MAQDIVTTGSREVGSILDEDKDDFVTFEIANQLFGIPVLKVQDIPKLETIASIPLALNRVKGSINLRGRIFTVASVRVCLGIGERDRARMTTWSSCWTVTDGRPVMAPWPPRRRETSEHHAAGRGW